MKIGFTGTQKGMTVQQGLAVSRLFHEWNIGPIVFHHGDCIGADSQAAKLATQMGFKIVCHPPEIQTKRAYTQAQEFRTPKPYLERNKAIVDETVRLIACPKGTSEELRSGTWATVRWARKLKRPIYIIWPDGSITEENA